MLSIYRRRFSTAELLIDKGANINEISMPLETPYKKLYSAIYIAVYISSPNMVKLLLDNGVVDGLPEAFEYAKRQTEDLPVPTVWNGDIRTKQERLKDAHAIIEPIKIHQRSVKPSSERAAKTPQHSHAAVSSL